MITAIRETLTAGDQDLSTADHVLADGVVFVVVDDGSSRLLNLSEKFYALPPSSTDLLLATLRHGSAQAVTAAVERYGMEEGRIRADLSAFLTELTRRGLVVPTKARIYSPLLWTLDAAMVRSIRAARLALRLFGSREWVTLTLTSVSIRLLGWARAADAWAHVAPLARQPSDSGPVEAEVRRIDHAIRTLAAAHPAVAECKERAMACWALLRDLGLTARLVVGIDLYPFLGHCWCEWDGRIVSDDAHRCYRFVPVWSRC